MKSANLTTEPVTAVPHSESKYGETHSRNAAAPLRGPFMRWPRISDALLSFIVFMLSLLHSHHVGGEDFAIRDITQLQVSEVFLISVAAVALYWRRQYALQVLTVTLFILVLSKGLGHISDFFGTPIAVYSVGRYVYHERYSDIAMLSALLVAATGELVSGAPVEDIGGSFFVLFVVWFIGRRIRIRGEYLKQLKQRAAQLERERENEARRAVAEERTRIARELHDIVAHQVSLMTVQAGAAKVVAVDDPGSARRAMQAVEHAGRQALAELRHLMGVLRLDQEMEKRFPQPGIKDVERLIEDVRQAGIRICYTLDNRIKDLPARLELSIFRIIQESLTNVLKYGGCNVKCDIMLSDDANIVVKIFDDGRENKMPAGSGHGINGMRERVQLLDGMFAAEEQSNGGFLVTASLPVEEKK